MPRPPPRSTLFPYTTLFRSLRLFPGEPEIMGLMALLLLQHARSAARFDAEGDRKSTRLNSSHGYISYAVFCLKKKNYFFLHFQCDSQLEDTEATYPGRPYAT